MPWLRDCFSRDMPLNYRLFAYGTLQLPEVFERVCGFRGQGQSARIHGFRRVCLKGVAYPAIIQDDAGVVDGLVFLSGLEAAHFQKLDAFEDDFYVRITVEVELASGERLPAQSYALSERYLSLVIDSPWDLGRFTSQDRARLLSRCD